MRKSKSEKMLLSLVKHIAESRKVLPRIYAGIGDDAAIFRPVEGQELLLTTDSMVEGVHFKREWLSSYEIGWRLAAVNLSDITAMGGRPLCALLSLAIPGHMGTLGVRELVRGLTDHLAEYGAFLVGGNLSGIKEVLVADLMLLGSCRKGNAWKRSCRPGNDAVVVVGELGSARAGLEMLMRGGRRGRRSKLVRAYIEPKPPVEVVELLEDVAAVHGAIDVSDGFSVDLVRMCEASGCGCEVDVSRIPVSRELERFCRSGSKDPLEYALNGGEDYALILSVSQRKAEPLARMITETTGHAASVVGRFLKRKGWYRIKTTDGKIRPLKPAGWDHLSSPFS